MSVMRIKEWRETTGMTQRQLGDAMGVDVSTVTKWETEVALPKTRDIPHLAQVLGCPIAALFVLPADGYDAGAVILDELHPVPVSGGLPLSSFDPGPEA